MTKKVEVKVKAEDEAKAKVEGERKMSRRIDASAYVALFLLLISIPFHIVPSYSQPQSQPQPQPSSAPQPQPQSSSKKERHLTNVRQLTVSLQNAEAYFSFDGTRLIFQSTHDFGAGASGTDPSADDKGLGCYQMYVMDLSGKDIRRVSPGHGATTCGFFFPGDRRVLYSSTHLVSPACPPKPERGKRYRWALDDYDIFANSLDGMRPFRLTATPGYDAEATISPDGKMIVFTSMRDGDLELYTMKLDGTQVRRMTHEVGYDGGGFFSPDSKRIVYRAYHPQNAGEVDEYRHLLTQNLVEPNRLEIYVMNADGSGIRQVTSNGAANFAPFFHPDGQRIIFASNLEERKGTFHLYLIGDDGAGLEQVTAAGSFNSFPMFSPDGTKLVWISDRNAKGRGEFNVFIADWVP